MSAVLSFTPTVASPKGVTAPSHDTQIASAVARLARSREQLRASMLPPPRASQSDKHGGGIGSFARNFVERIKTVPGVEALIERVEDWWARHPLRTVVVAATDTSRTLTGPIAERHPLALVFGAALVGALFVLTRPWRWALKPALFAGLLPGVASRALRELPVDSWLKILTSISEPQRGRTTPLH